MEITAKMKTINLTSIKNFLIKNKIVLIVIFSILFVDLILGITLLSRQKKSVLVMEYENSSVVEPLKAMNSFAHSASISQNGFAKFNFTDLQKTAIKNIYQDNTNSALIIRLEICPTSKQEKLLQTQSDLVLQYGFITNPDLNECISVRADEKMLLQNKKKQILDISIAFEKTNDGKVKIPDGFFVYSSLKCKILSSYAGPAMLGFDHSTEIPFYGFASNGGIINTDTPSFDFSGASTTFASQFTLNQMMPEYVVKLSKKDEHQSSLTQGVFVNLNIGGETYFIKNVKSVNEIILPASALKNPFSKVNINENKICVTGLLMRSYSGTIKNTRYYEETPNIVYKPIKTDPGLILNWDVNSWRTVDYELYEWDRFPGVLIFDTRNYTVQDNFFRRLAFFTEKEGYKGRLITNQELGDMHGFNALDYRPESIANFFNEATKTGFKLNREEIIFKNICLLNGLLIPDGDYVKPGYGGIVSISRESNGAHRKQLFSHEICHMFFFIDEEFRNFVAAVYGTMDQTSLQFLIDYFVAQKHLGYDINDEYLMHNELMAYLMQQPVSEVSDWFVSHSKIQAVVDYTPDLCEYIRNTNAHGFEDAAIAINDYIFDHYGVVAGNVALVYKNKISY